MARDFLDSRVDVSSSRAVSFCAVGALRRADLDTGRVRGGPETYEVYMDALGRVLLAAYERPHLLCEKDLLKQVGAVRLTRRNDARGVTQDRVLSWFDAAIAGLDRA